MLRCSKCNNIAAVKYSRNGNPVCRECFIELFELNVHETIVKCEIFKRGEKVAIGASGGKDSTVLAYLLNTLNKRYDYGVELLLLSIDEGIQGYRDDSLKAVERNRLQYGLPLTTLSYKDLYGWTMDEIVAKIGTKNNCTFCGVFRRQALDRGALMLGANKLVTGHNADDMAETVLMNLLRGDIARLQRCATIVTGSDDCLPRAKPLKYTLEKDIVMYAHFKKLDYFSTECIYAPNAYRGYARNFVKELERIRPRAILDLIHSGEDLAIRGEIALPTLTKCERWLSSRMGKTLISFPSRNRSWCLTLLSRQTLISSVVGNMRLALFSTTIRVELPPPIWAILDSHGYLLQAKPLKYILEKHHPHLLNYKFYC